MTTHSEPEIGIGHVRALLDLGRFDQALPLAQRLVAANPDEARSHELLGRCLLGLGRPWDAVVSADAARALQPEAAWAQRFGAFTHLRNSDLDDAASAAFEALRLDPEEPLNHWIVGEVELARRHLGPAGDAARVCVRLAPGLPVGYRILSRVAAASGDWKSGEAYGRRAVDLDPGDPAGWLALATALRGRGRLIAALRCYASAGRLGTPTAELRAAMTGTLFTLGVLVVLGVAAPAYALSARVDARWVVLGVAALIAVVGGLIMRRLPYAARHLLRRTPGLGTAGVKLCRRMIFDSRPGAESTVRALGAGAVRRSAVLIGMVAAWVTVLGALEMLHAGGGLITGPLLLLPGLFFAHHAYHLLRAAHRHGEPGA